MWLDHLLSRENVGSGGRQVAVRPVILGRSCVSQVTCSTAPLHAALSYHSSDVNVLSRTERSGSHMGRLSWLERPDNIGEVSSVGRDGSRSRAISSVG